MAARASHKKMQMLQSVGCARNRKGGRKVPQIQERSLGFGTFPDLSSWPTAVVSTSAGMRLLKGVKGCQKEIDKRNESRESEGDQRPIPTVCKHDPNYVDAFLTF